MGTLDALLGDNILMDWVPQLLQGAFDTLQMAILSFVLSLILGLALALARLSRLRLVSGPALMIIEVFRGTPLLTQLFIIYFSLSGIGISLSGFAAAVLGLTVNSGAYLAEIYRAGILAIDRSQLEAALSVGMPRSQAMRVIVLPQALRVVIPPITSYAVIILKATSLASIVAAPELMMQAHDLSSESFRPMEVYVLTAALYVAMAYPLSRFARHLEVSLNPGRR